MATQFSRAIVGACVVVSFAALVLPQFFNEKTDCGCANCNGSVCADLKPVGTQDRDMTGGMVDEGAELLGTTDSSAATANKDNLGAAGLASANNLGGERDIIPAEATPVDDGGYAALLEEEGAPAPADADASSSNRSGVVVGVRSSTNGQNNNFVSNPVATGTSPADAARIRAEKQRESAELRKTQEEERNLALEAQKREALKKEAARKLEEERLEAERKAMYEAQKKQEEERKQALAQKKKAEELKKQEAQAQANKKDEIKNLTPTQVAGVPGGRYLQLGVYSSRANADNARRSRKFSMSKADLAKAGRGFGFKIDEKSSPGKYILLLGPSLSDEVLQNLKAKHFGNAFIVNR